MYRQVGIYVVLVGVEVWSEGDRVNVTGDADETMNGFLEYRRRSISPRHRNDNAQLIMYARKPTRPPPPRIRRSIHGSVRLGSVVVRAGLILRKILDCTGGDI